MDQVLSAFSNPQKKQATPTLSSMKRQVTLKDKRQKKLKAQVTLGGIEPLDSLIKNAELKKQQKSKESSSVTVEGLVSFGGNMQQINFKDSSPH